MAGSLARQARTTIGRPLKVLIPLIQEELGAGNAAGLEHYRQAGVMLLEAREQVAAGRWGVWLSKNFALGRQQASRYMRLAQREGRIEPDTSITEAIGERLSDRNRQTGHWKPIGKLTEKVPVNEFKQEQRAEADEIRLHREIAAQLVDLGYRALATRLHPDKGGSKEAMARLNRVRIELKAVAETRRFV